MGKSNCCFSAACFVPPKLQRGPSRVKQYLCSSNLWSPIQKSATGPGTQLSHSTRPLFAQVATVPDAKELLLPQDFGRQVSAPSSPPTPVSATVKIETSEPAVSSAPQLSEPAVLSEGAKLEETKPVPGAVLEEKVETVVDEVSAAVVAFRELVGEEDAGKLEALLRAVGAGQAVEPLVLQPDAEKAHRTAVHNFFKARLPMLLTDTGEAAADVNSGGGGCTDWLDSCRWVVV